MPTIRFEHYRFVTAVCSSCHNDIHLGENGKTINEKLFAKITHVIEIETNIADDININDNKELLKTVKNIFCL